MWLNGSRRTILAGVWLALLGSLAQAQEVIGNAPAPENEQLPSNPQPSVASSIPALAQFKKELLDLGYNLRLDYFADGLGNPTGGVRQGAIYEGTLYMVLDADLAKIASLDGLSFRVNAYQIHGGRLSASNIFNLATVDSIEARPATRLFELWLEQKFGDLAFLRVGQLAVDNQFAISEFGNTLHINSTFGWPTIFTQDLPGEGPGYPLTTPGVRLKVTPNDQFALLAGLYNGDPSGAGFNGQPEILDPAGLNFRLRDPPLLLGEVQYQYHQNKAAPRLAGTLKLGAWYHFGKFNDEHFDVHGKSLADPSSNGVALTHSGDYGVYGVIDQMLWRLPRDDPKKGVGAFARAFLSPSDRNLIDFSANAGVNFMGLWDKRPDDSLGLAAAFFQLSPDLRVLDRERSFFEKIALPLRNYELVVELTYQAQIVAGWTIQPDFQYIFHPGGGVIDPLNPFVGRIPDAAVFGVRTMISF
jgi:porin